MDTHAPRPVLADAVTALVTASERPMSVASVFKQRARLGSAVSRTAIEAALDELAATGRLHRHPPARRGGAPLYGRLSPLDHTVARLAAALAGDAALSIRALRRVAGTAYAALVDEALAVLVGQGRVRASRFLTARQMAQIRSVVETVNTLRAHPIDLAAMLAWLDGVAPTPGSLDAGPTEPMLVRWYLEDLPRLAGLRAVPVPWTVERYTAWCRDHDVRPNIERVHRLLLDMAGRGVIGLTPHEHEGRLTEAERALLPRTAAGYLGYYWTVLR